MPADFTPGTEPLGADQIDELLTLKSLGNSTRRAARALLFLGSEYVARDRMDGEQLSRLQTAFDLPDVEVTELGHSTGRFRHSGGPVIITPADCHLGDGILAVPEPDLMLRQPGEHLPVNHRSWQEWQPDGTWTIRRLGHIHFANEAPVMQVTRATPSRRFGNQPNKDFGIHPFGWGSRVRGVSRDHLTLSSDPARDLVVDDHSRFGTRVVFIPKQPIGQQ